MDKYFDLISFDEKFKIAFKSFFAEKNLQIFQAKNGLSLFVSNTPNASYLSNTYPFMIEKLTATSITEKSSYWEHIRIPVVYREELTQNLVNQFNKEDEKNVFYQHITKFMEPEVVAKELYKKSLLDLENFLVIKKSTKSKPWIEGNLFIHIENVIKNKTDLKKVNILEKSLNNNKIDLKNLENQNSLLKLVSMNIDSEYKEQFTHYYENLSNFKNNKTNLFNYPQNILTIDINKLELKSYFVRDNFSPSNDYINKFLDNLVYVFNKKDIAEQLNITNIQINQKTQEYDSFRLMLSGYENNEKNKIEQYLKSFIQAYSLSKTISDKKKLNEISKSILLQMKLEENLIQKPNKIKNKI